MLEPFGPEIWIADGPVVAATLGFRYPTRMAVMRLANGTLFIWSPTELTPALRTAVDSLGEVRHVVAPNTLHHLFASDWQHAYPHARLHAPPELRKKRSDLDFDDLTDRPVPNWAGAIDQVVVPGNRITTEVVFFHTVSGTVLFTDLLQRLPVDWFSGWRALIARWDLMTGPAPSVPRKFRFAFSDREAACAALDRIRSWPAEKVLMAHGAPVHADGRTVIDRAFEWL